MTIVLNSNVNNYPLMLGDVLLSPASATEALPVSIPTFKTYPEALRQLIASAPPLGCCQKLIIVNHELVLGWSGPIVEAEEVVSDIVYRYAGSTPKIEEIKSYLATQNCRSRKLAITGIVKHGRGAWFFQENSVTFPTRDTAWNFYAIGSGSYHLNEQLRSIAWNNTVADRAVNKLEYAIALGLSWAGTLLGQELLTGATLKNRFGAGFELISLWGEEFAKLNRILYVVWLYDIGSPENVRILQVVNYVYMDEFLVVRTASFSEADQSFDCRTSIVRPLLRPIGAFPSSHMGQIAVFDYQWISSSICVVKDGQHVATASHVGQLSSRNRFNANSTGTRCSL